MTVAPDGQVKVSDGSYAAPGAQVMTEQPPTPPQSVGSQSAAAKGTRKETTVVARILATVCNERRVNVVLLQGAVDVSEGSHRSICPEDDMSTYTFVAGDKAPPRGQFVPDTA